jgi:hypothetical protein
LNGHEKIKLNNSIKNVKSDFQSKKVEAEKCKADLVKSPATVKPKQISQRISRYQQHIQANSKTTSESTNEEQSCRKSSITAGKLDTTSIAEKLKKSLSSPGRDAAPALIKLSRSVTPTPLLQATAVVTGQKSEAVEKQPNWNKQSPEHLSQFDSNVSYRRNENKMSKVQMMKNSIENDISNLNSVNCSSSVKKSADPSRTSVKSDYSQTPSLKKIANASDSLKDKRRSIATYLNEVLNSKPNENCSLMPRRPMSMSNVNLNSKSNSQHTGFEEPEPDYWDMASTTAQPIADTNKNIYETGSNLQTQEPVGMKKAVSLAEVIVQSITLNSANSKNDPKIDHKAILKFQDKCPKTIEKIFFQDTIVIKPDDEETYQHASRLVSQTPPLPPPPPPNQPSSPVSVLTSPSCSSATPSSDYYSNNMLDRFEKKQEFESPTKQQHQHSQFMASLELESPSIEDNNYNNNNNNNNNKSLLTSPDKYKISLNISKSMTTTTTTTATINNYLPQSPQHSAKQEQIHIPIQLPAPLDFDNLPSPAHFIPPPPPLPPPPPPPLQYQDVTSSSTIAISLTNVNGASTTANNGSVTSRNNINNTAILTIDSESLQLAKKKLKAKGPTSSVSSSSSSDTTHLTISTASPMNEGRAASLDVKLNHNSITTATLTATFSSSTTTTTTTSVPLGSNNSNNAGGSTNSKKNEFLLQEIQNHRLYNTKKDYVLEYFDRSSTNNNAGSSASTSPSSTGSSVNQSSENGSITSTINSLAMNRSLSNCNLNKKAMNQKTDSSSEETNHVSTGQNNTDQNIANNTQSNYEKYPYVRNRQIMPYTYQKYLPHNTSNINRSGSSLTSGNNSGMYCFTKRAQSNSCLASDRSNVSSNGINANLYEKNPSLSSNISRQINKMVKENKDQYMTGNRCASVDHLNKLGTSESQKPCIYSSSNRGGTNQQKEVSIVAKQPSLLTRPASACFDISVLKSELVDGRNPKVNNILQKLNKKSSSDQIEPVVVESKAKIEEPIYQASNVTKRFKQLQPPEKMESELDRVFKVCYQFN